jgi:uncharacterized protein YjbJ (UPF0337 family)
MRALAIGRRCHQRWLTTLFRFRPDQPQTTPDTKQMWEMIKGNWSQTKGAMKEQWGKLTDDDLLEIEGRRDQLIGKIQARYGITREEAEAQVGTWEKTRRL